MKLIKLAATTSAYISAIKRTNFEAVKRHSNEFRSQTPVHRTDWAQIQTHTQTYPPPTHTDINHLAQLNMKNPFRSVVIYAVSGFRQPQLKRRRHILVGIFLFGLPHNFFLLFFAICSKAANSSLILFCAWAFLFLHFPTSFSQYHCYFLCVSRAIFARLSCQAISAADI